MKTQHKNFAFLSLSGLLSPLFSMALVLAISRLQGVEVLGKYSIMTTVLVFGQTSASFGLGVVITREVAKDRPEAGRYFLNACVVTIALLLVALVIAAACVQRFVTEPDLRWGLLLVLAALPPSVVSLFGEAVLLGFERARDLVGINMLENTLRATVATILVLLGYGIVAIAVTALVLRLLASAAYVAVLRHHGVEVPRRIDPTFCRQLLRQIPVLGTIPIVNALYARADIFLLSWLGTWSDVGLYSAALRLVDVARTIPPAYARALYPVLSRVRMESRQEFAALVHRSVCTVFASALPVAFLLSGLASPLIRLLFGEAAAQAAAPLRILSWTLIPIALATTLAQVLFAANKQAIDLRVNVIATVTVLAAGAVLIPSLGAIGAATAVLLSTVLYACLQYLWVRRYVVEPDALLPFSKISLAGVASVCLLVVFADQAPCIAAATAILAYLAALGLAGVLTVGHLDSLRAHLVTGAVRLRGSRQFLAMQVTATQGANRTDSNQRRSSLQWIVTAVLVALGRTRAARGSRECGRNER